MKLSDLFHSPRSGALHSARSAALHSAATPPPFIRRAAALVVAICAVSAHAETVQIKYDDDVITLTELLGHYLRFVDPYSLNKQGEDEGIQYRTGVYYNDLLDGVTAETYFSSVLEPNYKIEIKKLCNYFPAEEYHQDYLTKNPHGYCHVNLGLIKPNEKKDA